MHITRRGFLSGAAGAVAAGLVCRRAAGDEADVNLRRYNLSVSIDAFKADPELLEIVRAAGVTDIWTASFFSGAWHHSIEETNEWHAKIRAAGMAVHSITIPLGHPTFNEKNPDYMPDVGLQPWQFGIDAAGRKHGGVCLHPPGTELNVAAMAQLKKIDPGIVFVDDDFRLAIGPGNIGGCFCDAHKAAFLQKHGYGEVEWGELLQAAKDRELTPLLRAWLTDVCDELTGSFRAQQAAAAPEIRLGIMVMYLGAEKAGIRLDDYRQTPMRVGELMFDDKSFAPVKGKTNELFSSLFHRRFVSPDLAYSETTAWPPDGLSAANMAAKLVISTISDVRNTMFMSGITPFPRTHWATLGPAMKKQAQFHRQIAGHRPRGPFKHYWGEQSRWVGNDNPYSLFLAAGVPFEVTAEPARDGWTFLTDFDARVVQSPGTKLITRNNVAEELTALFEFKRQILPELNNVPYVIEDVPAVCAWYPTAKKVLLWNLAEQPQTMTLKLGKKTVPVELGALGTELVDV
ncbi:MAG TPA: hypothetical protein VMZ06_14480 [Candidatus Bathyarchaeia archaeon]|nr:hypothetical protein [Candidatus Bathyarchaeia archaeon]